MLPGLSMNELLRTCTGLDLHALSQITLRHGLVVASMSEQVSDLVAISKE